MALEFLHSIERLSGPLSFPLFDSAIQEAEQVDDWESLLERPDEVVDAFKLEQYRFSEDSPSFSTTALSAFGSLLKELGVVSWTAAEDQLGILADIAQLLGRFALSTIRTFANYLFSGIRKVLEKLRALTLKACQYVCQVAAHFSVGAATKALQVRATHVLAMILDLPAFLEFQKGRAAEFFSQTCAAFLSDSVRLKVGEAWASLLPVATTLTVIAGAARLLLTLDWKSILVLIGSKYLIQALYRVVGAAIESRTRAALDFLGPVESLDQEDVRQGNERHYSDPRRFYSNHLDCARVVVNRLRGEPFEIERRIFLQNRYLISNIGAGRPIEIFAVLRGDPMYNELEKRGVHKDTAQQFLKTAVSRYNSLVGNYTYVLAQRLLDDLRFYVRAVQENDKQDTFEHLAIELASGSSLTEERVALDMIENLEKAVALDTERNHLGWTKFLLGTSFAGIVLGVSAAAFYVWSTAQWKAALESFLDNNETKDYHLYNYLMRYRLGGLSNDYLDAKYDPVGYSETVKRAPFRVISAAGWASDWVAEPSRRKGFYDIVRYLVTLDQTNFTSYEAFESRPRLYSYFGKETTDGPSFVSFIKSGAGFDESGNNPFYDLKYLERAAQYVNAWRSTPTTVLERLRQVIKGGVEGVTNAMILPGLPYFIPKTLLFSSVTNERLVLAQSNLVPVVWGAASMFATCCSASANIAYLLFSGNIRQGAPLGIYSLKVMAQSIVANTFSAFVRYIGYTFADAALVQKERVGLFSQFIKAGSSFLGPEVAKGAGLFVGVVAMLSSVGISNSNSISKTLGSTMFPTTALTAPKPRIPALAYEIQWT